ncbi:hypothetical protein BGZ93_008887 [Podila epicladia]|nr:hypothetical protein BGZ93_008887 [Podila epicladia]
MLGAVTDLTVKHYTMELTDESVDSKFCLSAKSVTSGAVNSSSSRSPNRCPKVTVIMICSMLLIVCSQKANYLQMVVGLYLFNKGAPRQLMGVLCKADNQDSFESGTEATLVIQEEFNDLGYKPGSINL